MVVERFALFFLSFTRNDALLHFTFVLALFGLIITPTALAAQKLALSAFLSACCRL